MRLVPAGVKTHSVAVPFAVAIVVAYLIAELVPRHANGGTGLIGVAAIMLGSAGVAGCAIWTLNLDRTRAKVPASRPGSGPAQISSEYRAPEREQSDLTLKDTHLSSGSPTEMPPLSDYPFVLPDDTTGALERAREHLLSLQDDAGWWRGEIQTNVTMDAEDMLLREFFGVCRADETERSAAWIRSQQREDGTWANFYGGPGELSTTVEAYCALRLAGDPPDAAHMLAASQFIRQEGGLERARVYTHVWLALFGLWSWDRVPALPPEIILLTPSVPLNIYDFAGPARLTIVALSLVKAHRPVMPLPFDVDELRVVPDQGAERRRPPRAWSRRSSWIRTLDVVLREYERRPLRSLRRLAIARAERWLVRRQEADGSWGGVQLPWVFSLIALHAAGYPLDHPVMRRGLIGLNLYLIEDNYDSRGVGAPPGRSRRFEESQSPVWDTALTVTALRDAGLPPGHSAILRAAEWLVGEEVRMRGDWAVARPNIAPGGWTPDFASENYPSIDNTAEVVLALKRVADVALNAEDSHERTGWEVSTALTTRVEQAVNRAARWVEGMQSTEGGWAIFDADNIRALVRNLPILDFGEVIDEPSADVTGHTVEMLAVLGLSKSSCARRGVQWLIDNQEADGSWFGRWGVNHIYGTGAAVPGLIAAGVDPSASCIRRAVRWLEVHQNEDGGWGEDPRSYDDPAWIGRGPSTASQTAWALIALLAARETSPSVAEGIAWLVTTQGTEGDWEEPQYTATVHPSDFYVNRHHYRLVFPLMALARAIQQPGACERVHPRSNITAGVRV